MERLQAAIEKARTQRGTSAPKSPAKRQTSAETVPDIQTVWNSLEEIHLDKSHLYKNRLTSFKGSKESAPYDMLRTKILQQAKKHGWRRVALVSPHSGCGKSTTAANLAFSLSRQRHMRSLVFDFDLRRAGLTKILKQNRPSGMADVLKGDADFSSQALRYGTNIAFALNNENKVHDPSEILQNPRTTDLLDEIEAVYAPELMLFDMPPLMASDDNFGFLQNVDCALVLAAAETTSMAQIDLAERQVTELTNMMGVVLNKCRYTNGTYGNEYDYY